jgi:hypothetical protein
MTLKEKFKERLYNQSHDDSECLRIRFENIDKVIDSQEKIADEFAIGFADWVNGEAEYLDYNEKGTVYLYKHNRYRTSELLEIYKKEQGL